MGDQTQGCRGKAGIWAGITGLVVAVFLMVVAHEPFFVAVFLGLLTVLLFGAFLIWAFCSEHGAPGAADGTGASTDDSEIPESPVETFNASSPEGVAAQAQAAAAAPTPAAEREVTRADTMTPKDEAATPEADKPEPGPTTKPATEEAEAEGPKAEPKAEEPKAEPEADETTPLSAMSAQVADKPAANAGGQPEAAEGDGKKPRGLKQPRKAGADDLKKIEGVGLKLEEVLNGWGIYHYDQIAKWGPEEIAYADQNVPRFKGRCTRDKWVSQAKIIVEEGMDAFLERAKTNDY
ncbi:putative flap endonuclease-1-like 5' DNA nuclease [Thioclava sp. ES.031]|uniref:hypothetical protein n=1 Tax=Thioclava sp. ES.031 TaxID=1798203 RepID=UPI000BF788F3|nr:hypothetical protein [Thioclava sp. ES.031]PFG62788.1 putative flap endonuclease-1-like 5' DNA nuclease [Thioclava sp. ES.031]